MKKKLLILPLFIAAMFLFNLSAKAQFALGIHGSYFVPDAKGADGVFGGGIHGKIFASPQFALGVGLKVVGEENKGTGYKVTNSIVPVTAMAEYYFSDSGIRPYIGAEAGVYFSSLKYEITGFGEQTFKQNNFGAGPKLGLAIPIGNLGIFAEGSYTFIFDNKDNSANTSAGNIDFKSSSKFFMVNAGITVGFGGK